MSTLEWVLIGILVTIVVGCLGAWLLWRHLSAEARSYMRRIGALPPSSKLRLGRDLLTDERIAPIARLLCGAFVVYLFLPIDLVPDFIPVVGQIDDVVVLVASAALLSRYVPRDTLNELVLSEEALTANRQFPPA